MADAFSIFLARNFMSSVPTPLLEAARIDGAGESKNLFTYCDSGSKAVDFGNRDPENGIQLERIPVAVIGGELG